MSYSAGLLKVENLTVGSGDSASLTTNNATVTNVTTTELSSTTVNTVTAIASNLNVSGNVTVSGNVLTPVYNNGLPNDFSFPELSLPPARDVYEGLSPSAVTFIENVIAGMTVEEMAAEMQMTFFSNNYNLTSTPDYDLMGYLNSVNPYYLSDASGGSAPRAGLPRRLNFGDHMRGVRSGQMSHTPCAQTAAASFDETLIFNFYNSVSEHLNKILQQGTFGPQGDYGGCLAQGRVEEAYGEDPELIYRMTKAQIQALQTNNVGATSKHLFEGYDTINNNMVTSKLFRESMMGAFKNVKDSLFAMSGAYNSTNGLEISQSSYLLKTVLRGYLQFNGVLMTDAFSSEFGQESNGFKAYLDVVLQQINAGIDLFLIISPASADPVLSLYADNLITLDRIKESVRRLFVAKYKLKLFPEQPGYVDRYVTDVSGTVANLVVPAFADTSYNNAARALVDRSVVLLKNEGNVLPLDPSSNVVLTGAGTPSKTIHLGTWLWGVEVPFMDSVNNQWINDNCYSVLDGMSYINSYAFPIRYKNSSASYSPSEITAINAAYPGKYTADLSHNVLPKYKYSNADISKVVADASGTRNVVVTIGFDAPYTHQSPSIWNTGGDVTDLPYLQLGDNYNGVEIPQNQQKLLEALLDASHNVILVFCGKQTQVVPDRIMDRIPAVLYCGQLGNYGGVAIAATLYGIINPDGHLPFSWPKHSSHYPCTYHRALNIPISDLPYPAWPQGQTNMIKAQYDPAFKFGDGLSYNASFEHSNMSSSVDLVNNVLNVSYTTRNTGTVRGKDLCAVYGFLLNSNIETGPDASWFMVDYKRPVVDASASQVVSFTIPLRKLAIVPGDVHNQALKKLVVPATKYIITDKHHSDQMVTFIQNNYATFFNLFGPTADIADSVQSTVEDGTHGLGVPVSFSNPVYFDEFFC